MTTQQTFKEMGNVLQAQLQTARILITLLDEENGALLKRDTGEIRALAEQKNERIGELEQQALIQSGLLSGAGLPSDKEGLSQYINTAPAPLQKPLTKLQTALHEALESCHRKNQVNGNILAANRQSAETALAIIRGEVSKDNNLYSANGTSQSSDETTGCTIAKV